MNSCDLQTVIQVPFEQRRIKKNLFGFHYTKKFLVVFDHFSPCVDFVIFHMLWYLLLRDFRNHEKRTEFRKTLTLLLRDFYIYFKNPKSSSFRTFCIISSCSAELCWLCLCVTFKNFFFSARHFLARTKKIQRVCV